MFRFPVGAQALSGWLVIASSSPGIPPGTLVEDPARLTVEAGASVTLMGEDGRLLTRGEAGAAAASRAAGPRQWERLGALVRQLFAPAPAGLRTGATRGAAPASAAGCSEQAGLERLARAGCREELAAALERQLMSEVAPDLFLYAPNRPDLRYGYGEPIDLRIVANFEAILHCFGEQEGMVEPLVPRPGSEPRRLRAGRVERLFAGREARPVAAPPPGVVVVRCVAVDAGGSERVRELLARGGGSEAGFLALRRAWRDGTVRGTEETVELEVGPLPAAGPQEGGER